MADVVWPTTVLDVLYEMPERDRLAILEKVDRLQRLPRLYPVRAKGRFRNHRWFFAGDWIVYYRVIRETVYVKGLWSARIRVEEILKKNWPGRPSDAGDVFRRAPRELVVGSSRRGLGEEGAI